MPVTFANITVQLQKFQKVHNTLRATSYSNFEIWLQTVYLTARFQKCLISTEFKSKHPLEPPRAGMQPCITGAADRLLAGNARMSDFENSTGHRWIPSQRAVTRSFDVFVDMSLNNRLSKQSRRRWFETPLHSSWRPCNVPLQRPEKSQRKHTHCFVRSLVIYKPCSFDPIEKPHPILKKMSGPFRDIPLGNKFSGTFTPPSKYAK